MHLDFVIPLTSLVHVCSVAKFSQLDLNPYRDDFDTRRLNFLL